jgi:hypothetical protein
VSAVDAPTLLAMKCAAARTGEDSADIRFLADLLGLTSSREILDVVTRYFAEMPVARSQQAAPGGALR